MGETHVPERDPIQYGSDGQAKPEAEKLFTAAYDGLTSSGIGQTLNEITQPALDYVNEQFGQIDIFDSGEQQMRRDYRDALQAEQAMTDSFDPDYQPEHLTDGTHQNLDGSSYSVKDGKINAFTTANGDTYTDIKYAEDNIVESMTLPDGSRLEPHYSDINATTGRLHVQTGYNIVKPGSATERADYESARVTSAGLVTNDFDGYQLPRATFRGMNGTFGGMTYGEGSIYPTETSVAPFPRNGSWINMVSRRDPATGEWIHKQ